MTILFDVRPDPLPTEGPVGLALLAILIVAITAVVLLGFVYLLKLKKRRRVFTTTVLTEQSAVPVSMPKLADKK
jgi:hypothetical protein